MAKKPGGLNIRMSIRTKFIGSFLIVALLAGITGIVGYVNIKKVGAEGVSVGEELAPLGDAAMEIKLTATKAHLIFEEIMAGDTAEDVKAVWDLLEETLFYCDAILSGRKNDEGTFLPSNDPAVLEKMKMVRSSVERFIQSARARYDNRVSSAGTGSVADQEFDSAYEGILKSLDAIVDRHKSDTGYMAEIVAAGRAKFLLADNHLFFEELLSGDDSVKFEDILAGLASARKEVAAMEDKIGGNTVAPILANIDTFIRSAETRHKNHSRESVSGHTVDATFDKEFEAFISLADEAEEMIHDSMDLGMANLKGYVNRAGMLLLGVILFAVCTALFIGFFLSRSVGNAFRKCLDLSSQISSGDLTNAIDLSALPGDETGALARELNTMSSNLKQMIGRIKSGVEGLKQSAVSLATASDQVESNSAQTTERSNAVAAASEQMNANVNSVASSTEQIASNIEMVASAAEQMISTIQEISGNTTRGNDITQNAVAHATDVSQKVTELANAAQAINKVTETISDISEQTNLLALNATIEAARAGDAGKGFAVVAGEIKVLAQQTAEATNDINAKINSIQSNISSSVAAMETIVGIIGDINDIVTTVSTAVDEQSVTSREISKNINQAAQGVQEVSDNMNQISAVTTEVSRDVSLVNQAARETSEDAKTIRANSKELTQLSENLEAVAAGFKL